MSSKQPTLFEDFRLSMRQSIELTEQSLNVYGPSHRHWGIAWSGGKDSTALLTVVLWLLESGRVQRPESLTVCYADTRMELPPLAIAAQEIICRLRERGIDVREVVAPLDRRFLVYMLGRGVPPPKNRRFRWCTGQIKIMPMVIALRELHKATGEKILMLTGVRQGESAIRDGKIAMSCGRDGAECGQGWYQETLPGAMCDTLAPLLHWRVCHVWQWLRTWAPKEEFGDWEQTSLIADAYGGDEAQEINARTGCMGCPLASKDTALEAVIKQAPWEYLAPLRGLRSLFQELYAKHYRLRQPGGECRKDGTLSPNQHRLGPLIMEARLMGLDRVLGIQSTINAEADRQGRPRIDILNAEEEARIRELIALKTWPQRWTGHEQTGDVPFEDTNDVLDTQMNIVDALIEANL